MEQNIVPPGSRPTRRPAARHLLAVVFTLVLAVAVLPDLFALDVHTPFVQLEAFRQWTLLATGVLLLVLAGVTVARRRAWPFVAGTLVVVVVGALLVVPRAVAGPVPTTGAPLTILSYNTYEGNADVDALADVIRTTRPDLVSLPEAGDRFRTRLATLIAPLGYRVRSSTGPHELDVDGVTTAVAKGLGNVSITIGLESAAFPFLIVTGGGLGALQFVAFHAVAPTPGSTKDWRYDIGLLPQWCAGATPAVVAGDFNATLDHSALRTAITGCGDAGAQRGDGLVPTWGPNDVVRHTIGPQIDHVLMTRAITASAFRVLDIPGSDHRAILTTLHVP